MSWGTDVWNSKMDSDADFYEKTIKPRFAERVRAILGVFPELSAEDLKKIKYDIEWSDDMKVLRKKLEQLVRKKRRKKGQ